MASANSPAASHTTGRSEDVGCTLAIHGARNNFCRAGACPLDHRRPVDGSRTSLARSFSIGAHTHRFIGPRAWLQTLFPTRAENMSESHGAS